MLLPHENDELNEIAKRHGVNQEALSEFKSLMERYGERRRQDGVSWSASWLGGVCQ